MPYLKTRDGTDIYVKDWGEGRPVVLLHGWPLSADMWDAQMMALAEAGFRAIAYDRRGFGRSGQPCRLSRRAGWYPCHSLSTALRDPDRMDDRPGAAI